MTENIGYLTWPEFAALGVAAVALLYVFITTLHGSQKRIVRTVESEDEECRGVAAHAFWWNGTTTQADDHEVPFALDTIETRDDFLRNHGVGR